MTLEGGKYFHNGLPPLTSKFHILLTKYKYKYKYNVDVFPHLLSTQIPWFTFLRSWCLIKTVSLFFGEVVIILFFDGDDDSFFGDGGEDLFVCVN